MAISTYVLHTGMGMSRECLPFLTDLEMENLNSIGYSGKTITGVKMSRVEYLNSLGKGEFDVKQTKFDNGDFQEAFIIVRVLNSKSANEV